MHFSVSSIRTDLGELFIFTLGVHLYYWDPGSWPQNLFVSTNYGNENYWSSQNLTRKTRKKLMSLIHFLNFIDSRISFLRARFFFFFFKRLFILLSSLTSVVSHLTYCSVKSHIFVLQTRQILLQCKESDWRSVSMAINQRKHCYSSNSTWSTRHQSQIRSH